jgi:transposase
MSLDLETFLTTLYVITDDLYKDFVRPKMPNNGGPVPHLSDSEVLCLGLAAQWRSGVAWKTERGFVRYAHKHLRPFFPGMTSQSAFNRRLRRLWGAYILIQQAVADLLWSPQDCEIMDCAPIPIARGARSFHPGWLADIARIGKGGNDRFFYGLHLLLVVSSSGVATGWTLAAGNIQDRWLTELLLSSRAGVSQLSGPENAQGTLRLEPPIDWIGPTQSCGTNRHCPVVADLGYSGEDWHVHWDQDYQATVVTPPKCAWHGAGTWFSSLRQAIETAFANLCENFGLHFPRAHTTWGLLTRISAKVAAYDLGILINRQCDRPDLALQTLIL